MKADKMRQDKAIFRLIPGLLAMLAGGAFPSLLSAQTCGFPSPAATQTGVLNTYYPGVGTWAAGSTHVHVNANAVVGLGQNIAVGDMLLLIQMQDADINTTNTAAYGALAGGGLNSSGLFEYVVAQNAVAVGSGAGVNLNITGANAGVGPFGTLNAYRSAAATAAAGQRTFQVVKVARYSNVTLSNVTATAWNGAAGGVVAVDASGTVTLSATTVTVNGQGFRGAPGVALGGDTGATTDYVTSIAFNVNGGKGEGIAGTPDILGAGTGNDAYPNGDRARGAPANGGGGGTDGDPGGNDQNTGGGAGSNGGAGGQGGWGWLNDPTPCPPITDGSQTGGLGGQALAASATRLFLGGGGGAGTRNNAGPSGAGNGGGIVLIRANAVAGVGQITANGVQPPSTANDGGGGGGAGGSIVVVAASGGLGGLTATAIGGAGGYANLLSPPAPTAPPNVAGSHHGPGGGGGGGVILLSAAAAATSVAGGLSGLTNQCPTSHTTPTLAYGATGGAVGILQTTLTLNSIPGVQICPALTRTSVIGLRVEGGTLEFATGIQRGTLGFNVFALEGDGTRVPLNRSLLIAPAPDTSRPTLYRVETGPLRADVVEIEEIEVGGRHRVMGPFAVSDAGLRESLEEIEVRHADEEVLQTDGARMLTGRRDPALRRAARRPERRPAWGAPGVKVEVSHAGVVTVPLAQLAAQGLPTEPERLRVTNLGRPVPFRVVDGGIQFASEELSTDFTGDNVFVISSGLVPPLAVELSRSGFPRVPGMVRVEQDMFFAPFVTPGMDPWVWDFLSTAFPTGPETFDLPGLVSPGSAVRVRIGLLGATDHRHSVAAEINGVPVGQVEFQGKIPALLLGSVPGSALRAAGNELKLTYQAAGSTADAPGLVFLDVLDLGVVLAPPSGPVTVNEVVAYDPRLPSLRGAEYLIVTHGAFLEQAERIAELKRQEGLRAVVVDVERAYDRFSAGVFEARAVQALIREAWRQSRVKYVLLVGGDTFDPRNHLGEGLVSFVPSLNGWDGVFGRVPSENAYADVDGDGKPDLAIGRLPVQTVAEADVMVDKIARQGDVLKQLRGRHLIAVEKAGPGDISFRGEGEAVAGQLPPGSQVTWADTATGLAEAKSVLLGTLGVGVQTTHYFGHGGFDRWSNGGLLRVGDAAALSGSGRETVLFTWTCEVQYYQNDGGPTVNMALLLVPQGGTFASVGPVGISDPLLQQQLSRRLYAHFLAGETLGEAMRRAKTEALEADPAMAPVVEGFGLLGDPALRLGDEP
jgi:hypothetical protein